MNAPRLMLVLLLVICFSLAAMLVPSASLSSNQRQSTDSVAAMFLGESRRLFANHLFVKADVYMHSGYYPTIFDGKRLHEGDNAAASKAGESGGHETSGDFLGAPRDWIDRLGRNFYNTKHTHLGETDESQAKEILPWLKLSAALDPQRPETYTVAAYWLRSHLKEVDAAEQFLREGRRENPDSYEILFELGRVFADDRKDDARARNVWELSLRKWDLQNRNKPDPDVSARRQILGALARLEERAANYRAAITHLQALKPISPSADSIQLQIDELQQKLK